MPRKHTSHVERALGDMPPFQIYRGLLPADILQALHAHILGQGEQKVTHHPGDASRELPGVIRSALPHIPPLRRANTLITERHALSGGTSAAPDWCRNPESYAAHPTMHCILGGQAVLSVLSYSGTWTLDIDCNPNTVVVLHDNPLHKITPPIGDNPLTLMFGGTDTQPSPASLPGK